MSLIEAAKAFHTELFERGDEIEAARRLPADLAHKFAAAGFYRICVPSVYGGLEADPITMCRVFETLAEADASAAWCVFIPATTGTLASVLPPEGARQVYGNPKVITCGAFAPRGKAEIVPGGYRVSGRWQWGSASDNADWITAGCIVTEGGKPVMDGAAPRMLTIMLPRQDVALLNNWHSSGLCGSGSQDFEIRDVIVPNLMTHIRGTKPHVRVPLTKFPQFCLLALGIGAIALGIGRASISTLIGLAGAKVPEAHRRVLATRSHTQETVAKAEASLRAARAFFFEALEAAWAAALGDGPVTVEARRDLRLATAHATAEAAIVTDAMYGLGGGTSVYKTSLLQRQFRDIHVATQHMMVAQPVLELAGRHLLGLEIDESLF